MLGFKILAYQTKIKDYILNVKQECSTNSYRGGDNPPTAYDCIEHISHINYNGGKTILKSGKNIRVISGLTSISLFLLIHLQLSRFKD